MISGQALTKSRNGVLVHAGEDVLLVGSLDPSAGGTLETVIKPAFGSRQRRPGRAALTTGCMCLDVLRVAVLWV